MTIKTLRRLLLALLTILAVVSLSRSLLASWQEPQIQGQIQVYQTDLLLQASAWQPKPSQSQWSVVRDSLLGKNVLQKSLEDYQALRQQLQQVQPSSPQISQADLLIGTLQAAAGQPQAALGTWQQAESGQGEVAVTARDLIGLWSEPPRVSQDSAGEVESTLKGWFRYQALGRIYRLQANPAALAVLRAQEQTAAWRAVIKLITLSLVSGGGILLGSGLSVILVVRFLLGRKTLWTSRPQPWSVPWTGETIVQVFVLAFFLVPVAIGQALVPLGLRLLHVGPESLSVTGEAVVILVYYVLFAGAGLGVLWMSLWPYLPLPSGWLVISGRGNWLGWGVGGYLVAVPLVTLVAVINDQIWHGKGGSNPLLHLILADQNWFAFACMAFTACAAAPFFEEILFRGFLLPSLARYLSLPGAIGCSSLLFALAHQSVSEVLPLMTLGLVLGVVYSRCRNLLATMVIHGLWNSTTLLSLYILGSGAPN